MQKTLKSVALTLVLLASPAVFAQHGNGMAGMEGMPKGDITKAEFLKLAEAHFEKMDTNKDGVVSAAERKEWHKQMREKRRQMRAASKPVTQ